MSKFDEWKKKVEEMEGMRISPLRINGGIYAAVEKHGVELTGQSWCVRDILLLRDWITENFDN